MSGGGRTVAELTQRIEARVSPDGASRIKIASSLAVITNQVADTADRGFASESSVAAVVIVEMQEGSERLHALLL